MQGGDEAPLLALRNLKTRFYTYEGTVQALDGIDFEVRRAETFGLVGETGCWKSVTALSVLRLVPSPPGKIEEGEVLFMIPPARWAALRERETVLASALSDLRSELKAKGTAATAQERSLLKRLDEILATQRPRLEMRTLGPLQDSLRAAKRDLGPAAEAVKGLQEIKAVHDLLTRSADYMRKIRGNLVAMIFQEPMSALNPVIVAGDQIAENILLHQKETLAEEVLRELEAQIPLLGRPFARGDVDPTTGLYRCGKCGTEVVFGAMSCASCGSRFFGPPRAFTLSRVTKVLFRALYRRMKRNPNDMVLKIASRVPFLRRYERVMYKAAMDRAVGMLREVRISDPEKVAKSYPFELSGGMAQRVMIAIALSCSPKLLIADEPTTAVDVTIQAQVLKLMKDLKTRVGSSILLITHNLGVVAETCDRVGVMYAGVMAEVGPTRSVFKEPLHPYTRGLMESIPRVTQDKDRLQIIPGTVPNLIRPPPGCRFHPRCPVALPHCGWASGEVRERLQRVVAGTSAGDGPAGLIESWDDTDPRVLVARCRERAEDVSTWIGGVVANHGGDVTLQAVESVVVVGDAVRLALKIQVKPRMIEVHPDHQVACYQYGWWPPA